MGKCCPSWCISWNRGSAAVPALDPATHFDPGQHGSNFRPSLTEWRSLLPHQFPLLTHLCHLPRWASAPNLVQNFALGCCNGVLHSAENKRGRPPSTVLISLSNRRRSTKQDSGAKAISRSGNRDTADLYRQQLNLWVLGKIADLKDADLLQYDHRRDRIEELREELESMVRARG